MGLLPAPASARPAVHALLWKCICHPRLAHTCVSDFRKCVVQVHTCQVLPLGLSKHACALRVIQLQSLTHL